MKNNIPVNQQTELPLTDRTPCPQPRRRHPGRSLRANWWFAQMRQTVDRATPPSNLNAQLATTRAE